MPAPALSLTRRMEKDLEAHLAHPRVSVVLVNQDGVDSLWHCLFALRTQAYSPEEIILVDRASTDTSVAFVKENYPRVKLLECPRDFSATLAANLGARYAQGDLVAFLSVDLVPTPDWLARLVEAFRRAWPKVGAVDSPVPQEAQPSKGTLNFLGLPVEGFFEDPEEVFHPGRGSLIYSRFLLPEGPFDEDFESGQEDAYLGWRVRSMGKGIQRCAAAKAYRPEDAGDPPGTGSWKSTYLTLRNRWLNLLLFYEKGTMVKVLPWMVVEVLALCFKGLLSLRLLLGTLFSTLWIIFHLGLIRQKRGVIQTRRKVGDAKVLAFVSGRLMRDGGWFSRGMNFISLFYCLAVGLPVMEFQGKD